MKCFTIRTEAIVGLPVTKTPYPHISVGERGRGRWEERVPLGKRDFPNNDNMPKHIERASVIQLKKNNKNKKTQYLIVSEKVNDNRALVLLETPMGYRGGTKWEGLEQIKIISEGKIAQGGAGRMGNYSVYLAIVPAGTTLKVHRFGRLYGSPSELVVHWDGVSMRVGLEDEVFMVNNEDGELI